MQEMPWFYVMTWFYVMNFACYTMQIDRKIPNLYKEYGKFDLDNMEDVECKAEFRFHKEDILVLAEVLGLPETFTCSQGSVTNGIEGLCIMLKRFRYTCRCSDLIPCFGHPVPVMSMICNTVVDFI